MLADSDPCQRKKTTPLKPGNKKSIQGINKKMHNGLPRYIMDITLSSKKHQSPLAQLQEDLELSDSESESDTDTEETQSQLSSSYSSSSAASDSDIDWEQEAREAMIQLQSQEDKLDYRANPGNWIVIDECWETNTNFCYQRHLFSCFCYIHFSLHNRLLTRLILCPTT